MNDVVSLSSLNVDYIYEAEDLSFLEPLYPEGGYRRQWTLDDPHKILELESTLKGKARLIAKSGGGSGANTAYCLAKMGFKSGLMGKIGRDDDAEFLMDANKIIPFQQISRNQRTGKSLIVLGPDRDRTIIRIPQANQTLVGADLDLDFIKSFSILHLTSLPGEGLNLQVRLVEVLAGKIQISFDPGETYVRKGLAALTPILVRCDWLFITEGELEILTNLSLKEAAPRLQDIGTQTIIIKKKGAGAHIFRGSQSWDLPSQIVQAQDTTGAGDVFAAGFLAGILKGFSLPDCGCLGLTFSHQSLIGLGRTAYPGKEDFEKARGKLL
ncbi:MAG: carbohydrate kinase family protein [Thermodesulfobacteriota bacterium]